MEKRAIIDEENTPTDGNEADLDNTFLKQASDTVRKIINNQKDCQTGKCGCKTKRYNEAIALDHVVPFRLITPEPRGGSGQAGGQ